MPTLKGELPTWIGHRVVLSGWAFAATMRAKIKKKLVGMKYSCAMAAGCAGLFRCCPVSLYPFLCQTTCTLHPVTVRTRLQRQSQIHQRIREGSSCATKQAST